MPQSDAQTLVEKILSPERRTYLIILIWALFYGALIAIDVLWARGVIDSTVGPVTDISYYRYRTQGILDGQWLYRDIPCESPPLIVYLMIPAQLANGGNLAYQVWFCIFVLLTALTLYWGLRRFDDRRAFFTAIMFLFIPVGTVETVLGIQDEAIMVWIFVLSIVLAAVSKWRESVLVMAIGAWTKVVNAFLYPFIWHEVRERRERLIHLGIIAAVSLFVAVPYLIVCPIDFLKFPLYYFLSSSTDVGPTGGTSIWDFLEMGGLDLPSWFFLILTIGTFTPSARS
jgi:Gpi18-like mannosyltransferase